VDSSGTRPRGARTQAGVRRVNKAAILVQRNGLFCCFIASRSAHAFLAIAPQSTKLLPVSCHQSSCRDCCLFHSTPRPLSLPQPTRNLITLHDHAPRRVWLVALTTSLSAIRRSIYDDTTALIHTHTHYRPSSRQPHNTTTKWLAP